MENNQETKEERRKRLARERAKRIYAEKKDDILAYKKNKYENEKKVPKEEQKKRGRKPIEKTYSVPKVNKKTKYTEDELINLINTDDEIKAEDTKKYHTANIRRFFNTAECEDLSCLKKDYKLAFNRVETATNRFTGEPYLPQTIQHTLKTILLIFNRYAPNFVSSKIKEYLQNKINQYTLQTIDYNDNKRETDIYPTFNDYIKKVKNKYGTDSKEYLVAKLYSEFSIRDDYGDAPILYAPISSKEINYFVLKKNYVYFILNVYKTSNRYSSVKYTFSHNVSNLIKKYINNNNINTGGSMFDGKLIGKFLFDGNLSPFVSNMNKELGYTNLGGINIFRHIRISELDGDNYEEKAKLLNEMGHSALTQPKYRRNLETKL